jgi:enamine deaminase RidA (YjgF/YER057c/UK114 family)
MKKSISNISISRFALPICILVFVSGCIGPKVINMVSQHNEILQSVDHHCVEEALRKNEYVKDITYMINKSGHHEYRYYTTENNTAKSIIISNKLNQLTKAYHSTATEIDGKAMRATKNVLTNVVDDINESCGVKIFDEPMKQVKNNNG